MATRGLRVVIISRSARASDSPAWGLGQDAKILEQVLREFHAGGHVRVDSVDHIDPVSFYGSPRKPRPVDIQIHLEVPCFAAWRFARINIVVVNPEWWPKDAWDWALAPVAKGGADIVVFKSEHARALFPEVEAARARVLAWRAGPDIQAALSGLEPAGHRQPKQFLFLIGASTNKLAAAKIICATWRNTWPPLKIIGSPQVIEQLCGKFPDYPARGITMQTALPTDKARIAEQVAHGYHIVASAAEGFGYTFAEAAAVGALPLWTALPVYQEQWGAVLGDVGKIPVLAAAPAPAAAAAAAAGSFRDTPIVFDPSGVEHAVESLLALPAEEERRIRGALRHLSTARVKEFRHDWRSLILSLGSRLKSAAAPVVPPSAPPVSEIPNVAIITLTRNRPEWFPNMARNILLSDYPPNKFTWIVADDGDAVLPNGKSGRVDEAILKFQSKHPHIQVKYLSIPKAMHIGAKRNKACDAAPADCSVFLMMDDDDHYPKSSIIARIAWLRATGAGAVYCATLPMYDCRKYISAMNVPPLDLAPAERVSEASLAFTRKFYESGKFPAGVSIAEGEGFVVGRTEQTVEIPPEGVIVSFLHGKNATSRRVPESSEPNGCHYGFDEAFFTYISQIGTGEA